MNTLQPFTKEPAFVNREDELAYRISDFGFWIADFGFEETPILLSNQMFRDVMFMGILKLFK